MAKRLSWLVVLGAGCVFTPRPMIPLEGDDAGEVAGALGDGGRATGGDAWMGTPSADGGTGFSGDAAADAPPSERDSECRPTGDAGDAGYIGRDGSPCDPAARDGGARDVPDAACDGPSDAPPDGPSDGPPDAPPDAACDGGAAVLARGRR